MRRTRGGVVLTRTEAELVLELCSMSFKMSPDLELWQSKHVIAVLAAGLVKSLGFGKREVKAIEALTKFTKVPEQCARCSVFLRRERSSRSAADPSPSTSTTLSCIRPRGRRTSSASSEGGWDASYYSYGVWTSFGSLGVTIGTNVVSLTLNDLNSDVSTNHTQIIIAGGEAAGEIAEHIIDAIKKVP